LSIQKLKKSPKYFVPEIFFPIFALLTLQNAVHIDLKNANTMKKNNCYDTFSVYMIE